MPTGIGPKNECVGKPFHYPSWSRASRGRSEFGARPLAPRARFRLLAGLRGEESNLRLRDQNPASYR